LASNYLLIYNSNGLGTLINLVDHQETSNFSLGVLARIYTEYTVLWRPNVEDSHPPGVRCFVCVAFMHEPSCSPCCRTSQHCCIVVKHPRSLWMTPFAPTVPRPLPLAAICLPCGHQPWPTSRAAVVIAAPLPLALLYPCQHHHCLSMVAPCLADSFCGRLPRRATCRRRHCRRRQQLTRPRLLGPS